ncbi:MAG TPA: phosphoribosylglycinamide formyltransferase [Nitrososphaeraceae archaeon]|jgi:phosphoribosylglycinamide formyltransferase-1|nr:phosphoribosylglycinamide formyltransferase [Nitrososphaeraceae archaeon]
MINLAIIISGRGSNMKAILSSILSGNLKNVNPAVVISNRKDAIGLEVAKNNFNIPTEIVLSNGKKGWDYDKEIVSKLRSYNVLPSNGLICLAGYMKIISTEFVNEYKFRIMNIHPALLPSFRGLHAQKQALDYGVKVSGCTVHFVNDEVDTGPIILQQAVNVYTTDTEEDISNRILELEHKLYPQAVKLFAENKLKVEGRKVIIL